uniref:Uncharacterized protein n=1 Tax=Aureoumbra lagunensis TaxID=44058 RepID=A0A7S3NNJ6_9STRA|mmetsp:Transcript_9350/g.12956  ORF Transcript_9350/g.12956 Transcript_9350/m.12956 type:complete len:416 (+) Transcript_9350:98-1345(+)|eukprot:CAMPEP_0197315460 /NCGR_PEP_ID=MMETSP0891-20130614/38352_1 /TAXON_ID=44058 ORGANISM="Aureoumbra lagunensis, Strain CCMP1510" /NCGR_SAMPLE_ID=MMETSP0891 /ASSEMBLY_ACC=CAM_ASM_000534 /LENGTH=415 /DNA_ID=CAMNT_0042804423 /DNA_START=110 /DNA_END=1357 /DNA_ORIENTATION=+
MPIRNDASALLDELMGQERNAALSVKAKKKFWEDDVCKFYLVGLSPYNLLKNTRGYKLSGFEAWVRQAYLSSVNCKNPASMVCDINLRSQYQAENEEDKNKYGYNFLLFNCLTYLIRQMDRRISINREKIAKAEADAIPEEIIKQIMEIEQEIKTKIQESEQLGEVGEIEESMRLANQAETLKIKKRTIETEALKNNIPNSAGQRFTVCNITGELIECGAAKDTAWMTSHIESSDYQAWKTLREWYTNLSKERDGRGPPRGIPNYRGTDNESTSAKNEDTHLNTKRQRPEDNSSHRYDDFPLREAGGGRTHFRQDYKYDMNKYRDRTYHSSSSYKRGREYHIDDSPRSSRRDDSDEDFHRRRRSRSRNRDKERHRSRHRAGDRTSRDRRDRNHHHHRHRRRAAAAHDDHESEGEA